MYHVHMQPPKKDGCVSNTPMSIVFTHSHMAGAVLVPIADTDLCIHSIDITNVYIYVPYLAFMT